MTPPRISVVGMACRYPDAADPEQLWQNVLAGRRAFRRLPEERVPTAYRGGRDDVERTYLTRAAVLRDWEFDRAGFGVPGALHRAVDHTHWLALETAAAALADAGHPRGAGLRRSAVGVVIGNSLTGEFSRASALRLRWPYVAATAAAALRADGMDDGRVARVLARMEEGFKAPFPVPGDETLAGALANTIAGRICNTFDLNGTGYTVDGACSSSLLAVNLACSALAAGDVDVMLAGGVDLSLDPFELVGFARLGALAEDDMRVYDASPTGFLPGEGCGVLVLMRAEDARRAGARVYADIVGWASSSDGAGGLTRPAAAGQVLAMRRAYARAGLHPCDAGLIEGHGTGTAVGDEVEIAALTELRGLGSAPAVLGTIKANIGHTKAAAGVAGLVKLTQAVHRRVLPPTTGTVSPHPLLRAAGVPLRLLDRAQEWTDERPVGAVSSMGFGGINAHVVIAAAHEAVPARSTRVRDRFWSRATGRDEIVALSADSPVALARDLEAFAAAAAALTSGEIRDVAATTWRGASRRPFRAALVGASPEQITAAARAAARAAADGWGGEVRCAAGPGWALGGGRRARVGLLLPGQAAPVHADAAWWADRCGPAGAAVSSLLPRLPTPTADGDHDTAVAQPWVVAQSLLALAWISEIGCDPVVAVGHSLGEISALSWAGALTPEAALRLAVARGAVMASTGTAGTGMAALATTAEQARHLCSGTAVVIAGDNAHDSVALSGPRADLTTVLRRAAADGVAGVLLPVSHGFHSEAMADAEQPLREVLDDLPIHPTDRAVLSTVTGAVLPAGTGPDEIRKLLVSQLTQPVLFRSALRGALDTVDLLVEAGPGAILSGLAGHEDAGVPAVALDAGGPTRSHAYATAVLAATADADLTPWFDARPHRVLDLTAVPRFLAGAAPARGPAPPAAAPPMTAPPAPDAPPADRAVEPDVPQQAPGEDSRDVLDVLVAHLAEALELPASAVRPELTLLGDLHLSSLQVVQTTVSAASALGLTPPATPSDVAGLTVGDLAAALARRSEEDDGPTGPAEPPLRPWVRAFTDRWDRAEPRPAPPTVWTVEAPDGHPWHRMGGAGADGATGWAIFWDRTESGPDGRRAVADRAAGLLRRAATGAPTRILLGHHDDPAAVGTARALAAELDGVEVVVLDTARELPADPAAWAGAGPSRYRELRMTPAGPEDGCGAVERVPVPVAVERSVEPLHRGDVCLVTGGASGVTARCARELAEETGAVLVLLGRTDPADPRVAEPLATLAERVDATYVRCDLADPAQVRAAVVEAARRGPVRGLLHGAAVNRPRRLAEVEPAGLAECLAPKVSGLDALLREVGEQLRLVVTFGSIIGRQGLHGQAEYCVANDWLRHAVEAWAREHPAVRAHHVEFSAWAGVGMAQRLGVLQDLRRRGVVPIDPDAGAQLLLDLLGDPRTPTTVLATSRFTATSTLALPGVPGPLLRFAEERPVLVPGVETVTETELSHGDDPYLSDHRIDGVALLPAVLGVEAMAQAAAVLSPDRDEPARSLADLRFDTPVTVPDRGATRLRVVALADPAPDGSDRTEVVLRADTDGFGSDRFRGVATTAPARPPVVVPSVTAPPERDRPHPLYGGPLFHRGRFTRLVDYTHLSAFRIAAWVRADGEPGWFSAFHAPDLLLGDPGAHDAALHVLLPCLPHRLALPVGAERFTVWDRPAGMLHVEGAERPVRDGQDDAEHVFDVLVRDTSGVAVARWDGLVLRVTGAVTVPDPMPEQLAGPWVARRVVESGIAGRVELTTPDVGPGAAWVPLDGAPAGGPEEDEARVRAARAALGGSDGPLTTGTRTADGLVELRLGADRVVAAVVRTTAGPVVVAVAVGPR